MVGAGAGVFIKPPGSERCGVAGGAATTAAISSEERLGRAVRTTDKKVRDRVGYGWSSSASLCGWVSL